VPTPSRRSTSHRRATRRRAALAAICAAALAAGALGCRGAGERATGSAADPGQRLGELLRRGAEPGELTVDEREEVERLLLPLLPATEGELAGHSWRVAYDDLPAGDFVSLDLLAAPEPDDTAPRAMWFHLFWRGAPPAAEPASWTKTLDRWPARGVEGHHLFVRVGRVELRAVAEADAFRDEARIRETVEAFDLEALSEL
jgi:hypothetical protein